MQANDGRIIAAAALSPRSRTHPEPGPRVAVHVIPPARGQGIGHALVDACASVAKSEGAGALYAWSPITHDAPEAHAWNRLGFDQSCHVLEARADLARALAYLTPYYDRVVADGWIPHNARLVPLNRADPAEVARLQVQHLGGQLDELVSRISGRVPPPYHPEMSPVILVDGRVKAFTLALPLPGGVALAESTVVDPSLRGGWANLWLKVAGASASLRLGLHTLLYYTYDRHTDTRKLGRQVGGSIRDLIEPYRMLSQAHLPTAFAPSPGARDGHIPSPI